MVRQQAEIAGQSRQPVFPEGVPGVQQGVPPELMKGYQAQTDQQAQAQAAAEEAQKPAKKSANARRPSGAPRAAAPAAAGQPASPAAPAGAAPRRATARLSRLLPKLRRLNPSAAPVPRWRIAGRAPTRRAAARPQQQQQQQQPQQSATTRPWPGSEPQSGPPTDRFSR